jgi:hypothetical protein
MLPVNNYINDALYNNNNNLYNIIAQVDFDDSFDNSACIQVIKTLVEQNPVLQHYIVTRDNTNFWVKDDTFCIDDMFTSCQMKFKNFDKHTQPIINAPIITQCKWHFFVFNDDTTKCSRVYLKIAHIYCDGYKLIDILAKCLNCDYTPPEFKRIHNTTQTIRDKIYYLLFGTIMLLITNIQIAWRWFIRPKISRLINKFTSNTQSSCMNEEMQSDPKLKSSVDHVSCPPIPLDVVKTCAKKNGITINDLLFAVTVKTMYYYNKKRKGEFLVGVPIQLNKNSTNAHFDTNNVFGLLVETNCYCDNNALLQNIHQQFNLNKYSAYIPIAHKMTNVCAKYIPNHALYNIISTCEPNIDITYTNMIANSICTKNNSVIPPIKNLQFYTMPLLNAPCFNIISFQNHINCNITFNSGVIKHKKRFKRCFLKAFRNLIV